MLLRKRLHSIVKITYFRERGERLMRRSSYLINWLLHPCCSSPFSQVFGCLTCYMTIFIITFYKAHEEFFSWIIHISRVESRFEGKSNGERKKNTKFQLSVFDGSWQRGFFEIIITQNVNGGKHQDSAWLSNFERNHSERKRGETHIGVWPALDKPLGHQMIEY